MLKRAAAMEREVRERMRADGKVHVKLDKAALRAIGSKLAGLDVDCVVVCFLHAHAYPRHEARAAAILKKILGRKVAVITSAQIYPEFREYERLSTTVLNAVVGSLPTPMAARMRPRLGSLAKKAVFTSGECAIA